MNTKTIVAIAAILVVLGAGYAVARPANGGFWNGMMGYGNGNTGFGMMGGYGGMMGNGNGMMGYGTGSGSGMMGGNGGMMNANGGSGAGHCGAGVDGGYGANTNPITIDEAKTAVEQYLATTGDADLKLTEVMEFDNNFYAGVKETSTGKHAFELLVNKYTGAVFPEMGPNMMWNTKYGHMNWNTATETTVNEKKALEIAQDYLDRALPGTKVADADTFYGYYTIEVTKDAKLYGMLSVNANTGAVWYHNWHGAFVKILEVQ